MGALRALKELRRKDTLKPALEALQDGDAAVRVQAIGVIGFLKLEESIPALTASTGARCACAAGLPSARWHFRR
jgi:HEAT repeat protein